MWKWNSKARRYYNDDTGRFMPKATVLGYVDDLIGTAAPVTDTLANLVLDVRISPADWHFLMREEIKREYITQYLLGIGGRAQMTPADWGRIGGMLKEQYGHLDGFLQDILDGKLSEAQIAARSKMYSSSAREAYERANGQAWGGPPLPAFPGDGSTICLCITTPEARVLTTRGWLPMLDVRVGDLVLTHRERWRPVTGLLVKPAPPGEKEVLFDLPGAVVGCTEDHLWYSPQGWVSARDIDTLLYPMYNHLIEEVEHGDKDLCPVRFTLVESEQATPVQVLSVGMCLREAQGLQGRELPSVCNEEKCHTPVEYGRGQGQEIAGSPQGRDREANAIRGLGQAEMAAKSRRTLLQQVLGWAVYPLGLSVSMGLGNGKRSNSQRPCDTPQESGCDRRQIGEFRASAEARSFQTSRGGGAQEKRGRLTDLDMSVLRQGVSPIPTREEWRPKVLLGRTLPRGTAVYDLMVEDDHSFIIEGLVAHNTNCNCNWDIRSAVAEEGRMRWTCYWRLGFVKTEHCADCIDRALSWAPLILEA